MAEEEGFVQTSAGFPQLRSVHMHSLCTQMVRLETSAEDRQRWLTRPPRKAIYTSLVNRTILEEQHDLRITRCVPIKAFLRPMSLHCRSWRDRAGRFSGGSERPALDGWVPGRGSGQPWTSRRCAIRVHSKGFENAAPVGSLTDRDAVWAADSRIGIRL